MKKYTILLTRKRVGAHSFLNLDFKEKFYNKSWMNFSSHSEIKEYFAKKGFKALNVWAYVHGLETYRIADFCPFPDYGFDSGIHGLLFYKGQKPNIDELNQTLKQYADWINGCGDYADDMIA